MQNLPIDGHLPALLEVLKTHSTAVLRAEPGAGKTTRVPWALAEETWARDACVWVLQPRRLAAAVAAQRISEERGLGAPGGRVGYHFRFERRESQDTRILFLTEGMFLRRLQADPNLSKVACVVLDEFHERSLDVDLSLALLRRLKRERPDLRLVLMSATLDAQALAAALGGCPVVECPGRAHPVEIAYLDSGRSDPSEALERRVLRALGRVRERPGDVLVFLPGVAEIRRVAQGLAGDPKFDGRRVLALRGRLSAQEQRAALLPADRPKIILATNVAETSLTVPGVRVVVDSTLTRRDAFNPFNGLSALVTLGASRASMDQRAGRAGREAPGFCLRVGTAAEFQARPAHDDPEILRADLAPALLRVLAAGPGGFEDLPWLIAPPAAHVMGARALLESLGALGPEGVLSPKGLALARAPLHPRLAALAYEARAGTPEEMRSLMACVALLESGRPGGWDFLAQTARHEPQGSEAQLARQVQDWLEAERGRPSSTQGEWLQRLGPALLRAFPDQVAETRHGTDRRGETRFHLAGGGEAVAREEGCSVGPGLYLLTHLVESRALGQAAGLPRVLGLMPVQAEWLLDAPASRLRQELVVEFDAGAGRVQVRERLAFGALVLEESEARSPEALRQAAERLLREARKAGLEALCGEGQPARYLARRAFALGVRPGIDLPSEEDLWGEVEALARTGVLGFAELARADPLKSALDRRPAARRELEAVAPARLRLAGGRETTVHYEIGKAPWVAGRIQDFFGMNDTPRLGGAPVTVHLMAPNQRPQQVTQDLSGFWEREYPRLRKELMRRYPRHAWPERPCP